MILRLQTKWWAIALALGVLTALAGVLLVGVSSWFLAAVALAGIGPAALLFNFHFPAALVRLLALTRTAGKYAERVTGHEAALADQAQHRAALFRRMAASETTRVKGWQLAQADQLEAFLGDVEADDFEPLRFSFPAVIAAMSFLLLAVATVAIVPWALLFLMPLSISVVMISLARARSAARADDAAREAKGRCARDLGHAHAGLLSLHVGGERDGEFKLILDQARYAEAKAGDAQRALSFSTAATSLFGPLAAGSVILTAWAMGARDEVLLLPILIGFSWLAFGELVIPLGKQIFAYRQADMARGRLATWRAAEQGGVPNRPSLPETVTLPVVSPLGLSLAADLTLSFRPGEPSAILGSSGCGKTTALKQLAGWLPWGGKGPHPLGDEVAAQSITHLSLHDAVVMKGSVRNNLFSEADDAQLWQVLRVVELDDRVLQAGGLDAVIRQDVWSLGEARRLELARALLSDKPIILLDEPGEHIRDDQAARVLRGCLEHLKDRRVVFVTHQPILASLAVHREVVG